MVVLKHISAHILFWIKLMISRIYQSVIDEDCRALKVTAHKVQKIGTVLHFSSEGTVQSSSAEGWYLVITHKYAYLSH